MKRKFLTMADKIKGDIDRIKDILEMYNNRDINDIRDKKEFMQKQLKEREELYIRYKENNEPYYEPYTYEYYKNIFLKNTGCGLKDKFIYEVSLLTDKESTISENNSSQKIKILEDIIKAYNEVDSIIDNG